MRNASTDSRRDGRDGAQRRGTARGLAFERNELFVPAEEDTEGLACLGDRLRAAVELLHPGPRELIDTSVRSGARRRPYRATSPVGAGNSGAVMPARGLM